ncbi:MAG: hypothetical protein WAK48_08285 [Candidatus Acidiferrum sp.]
MAEETLCRNQSVGRRNVSDGDQRNTEYDSGNDWYSTDMGGLAQAAGGFILAVAVSVRGDLQEENEGKQRQGKRQGPRQAAGPISGLMSQNLHPPAPQQSKAFACIPKVWPNNTRY